LLRAEDIHQPISRRRAAAELLIVFAAFLSPVAFRYVVAGREGLALPRGDIRLYGHVLLLGLVGLSLVALVKVRGGYPWRTLGFRCPSFPVEVAWAIGALIAIYVLQLLIGLVFAALMPPETLNHVARQRLDLTRAFKPVHPAAMVAFCLYVGFYEETVFRGFLITRLRAVIGKGSWLGAVLVSSVFFGVIHWYQGGLAMVQISVVALVLGAVFVMRGSLVAPMVAHALFDFMGLAAFYYVLPHLNKILKLLDQEPQIHELLKALHQTT